MPILDLVAERRVYLPFIGLLLVVVEFVRRWKAPPTRVAATLAGVLVVMAVLTYNRSAVWGDPEALWKDTVSKSPLKARPHLQLGFLYFTQQRCAAALPEFEAAAKYGKPTYPLLVDCGMTYECLGRHDEAIDRLRQATLQRAGRGNLVDGRVGLSQSRPERRGGPGPGYRAAPRSATSPGPTPTAATCSPPGTIRPPRRANTATR